MQHVWSAPALSHMSSVVKIAAPTGALTHHTDKVLQWMQQLPTSLTSEISESIAVALREKKLLCMTTPSTWTTKTLLLSGSNPQHSHPGRPSTQQSCPWHHVSFHTHRPHSLPPADADRREHQDPAARSCGPGGRLRPAAGRPRSRHLHAGEAQQLGQERGGDGRLRRAGGPRGHRRAGELNTV